MMAGSEFLDRFEEFLGASGWRVVASPSGLVEQWRDFVEVCHEGYSSTIYEYENERSVRDLLEKALNDPVLRTFPEIGSLRESIEELDRRFRGQCRRDAVMGAVDAPWWKRCVPRRVDGEFAEDLRSRFGIEPLG